MVVSFKNGLIRFTPSVLLVILYFTMIQLTGLWAGTLEGRITYRLADKTRAVMLSPYARNAYRGNRSSGVSQGQVPEQIIVYLAAHTELNQASISGSNPVVDQINLEILPHVTTVVQATTVDFHNSDRVYHNLFSLSKAKSFNLGRYATGESKSILFDEPGVVEIFCDIHADMNGVVLVVPNRYFAAIDKDGNYRINDIPPGTYTVIVWREKSLGASEQITIDNDNSTVIVNFSL